MKPLLAIGAITSLSVSLMTMSVQARPYEDLQKCEELRPRACGIAGTPSCKSVQAEIDACKQKVREQYGRDLNKKK